MSNSILTRAWFLRAGLTTAALSAVSCNQSKKKQIAVIPKGRAHVFWQSVHAGAVKGARENDVEVIWNGPATETDFNAQIQITDAMINRRVDAICLAPIDKQVMVTVVERAAKENIPVVIFDSGIDTEKFLSQVMTDNKEAGRVAARRMDDILGGKGKVIMVAVQPGGASTMLREEGFEEELKKFPGIQIVDKRYGYSDYAKSLQVAENMLTAFPDVAGLFASNESSAAGAAQALKARPGSKVKAIGFDSSPALVADLKAGVFDSLVIQDPFKMGYESVLNAIKGIKSQSVVKINNMAPQLVTQQDLATPEVQAKLNPDLKKYLD
jgi:ribose transport system substrate-binding protein